MRLRHRRPKHGRVVAARRPGPVVNRCDAPRFASRACPASRRPAPGTRSRCVPGTVKDVPAHTAVGPIALGVIRRERVANHQEDYEEPATTAMRRISTLVRRIFVPRHGYLEILLGRLARPQKWLAYAF